jgi:hypothetical protein
MKAMETIQQKVKNALKLYLIVCSSLLLFSSFGGVQSKSVKTLDDEQYNVLNDFFKNKTFLFYQTSTLKSWGLDHTSSWFLEKMDLCLINGEEEKELLVKELMDSQFQSNLKSHLFSQTVPITLDKNRLKTSGIKLISKDIVGGVSKISAPYIFENKALIYFESPLEESVFYLKKNKSGKWEWVCKFTLITIFSD